MELLYANDLVVIDETEDNRIKRHNDRKDNVKNRHESKYNKTKVMFSAE